MRYLFFVCGYALHLAASASELKPILLTEAAQSGVVSYKLCGSGEHMHHGKSLLLQIQNNSGNELLVNLPAGYLFEPEDESYQTMVLTERLSLKLSPKIKREQTIYAMCAEMSDASPTPQMFFKASQQAKNELVKVAHWIYQKNYQSNAAQQAVWCVTDGHSLDAIQDGEKPDLAKELKQYVAMIVKNMPPPPIKKPVEIIPIRTFEGNIKLSTYQHSVMTVELLNERKQLVRVLTTEKVSPNEQFSYIYNVSSDEMGGKRHYVRIKTNGNIRRDIELNPN